MDERGSLPVVHTRNHPNSKESGATDSETGTTDYGDNMDNKAEARQSFFGKEDDVDHGSMGGGSHSVISSAGTSTEDGNKSTSFSSTSLTNSQSPGASGVPNHQLTREEEREAELVQSFKFGLIVFLIVGAISAGVATYHLFKETQINEFDSQVRTDGKVGFCG